MLETLDAEAIRRWSVAAVEALDAHRAEIDELNVFPVPDGDTGTNLALTLRAAAEALGAAAAVTAGDALGAFARGAVLDARGNSGVIMAQLLHGLATAANGRDVYGGKELREGLHTGVVQAYQAVAMPVEGTILTVARAALEALPPREATLAELVRAAVAGADTALAHTPEQLSALARAGVVDAGGRGLVLLLDALAAVVLGGPTGVRTATRRAPTARSTAIREGGSSAFDYEVQYLVQAPAHATVPLRQRLTELGDSVVIAGTGDGTWNVHAHVNDVGAAIEAGIAAGDTSRISVVRFESTGVAVLAVAPGDGMAHLFGAEGVTVLDDPALTADEVAAAVRATGATQVILLPNASSVAAVAAVAAEQVRAEGVRVAVVPTRSPVQGLAAVAVHDPGRGFDDDVVAMAEAAAATRFAEVTVAREQSLTTVGICQAGDVLGMIDGEVVEIGHGTLSVGLALVDRLLGVGAELLTVLVGRDAPPGTGDTIAGHVRERAPLTDVAVYTGDQPRYPLIIGVE